MKSKLAVNKNTINNTNFFFIIGRPRSGTTLIRTLFDAHPNVCIPLETRVIPALFPKYGHIRIWSKKKLISFFHDAINQLHFDDWTADNDKLLSDILAMEGKACYSEVLKVFYLNYISFFEKEKIFLIADKTPNNINYLSILDKVFPEAKYIHIIREPHEHVLSLQKVEFGSNNTAKIAYNWNKANKAMEKFKMRNPNRCKTVYFERFVETPEIFLKEWCSFLSIEYSKQLLNFSRVKQDVFNEYSEEEVLKSHKSLFYPIKPKNGNNWKQKMSEKEIMKTDFFAKEMGLKYDYEINIKKISKIRLFSYLPKMIYLFFLDFYIKIWHVFTFTFKPLIYKYILG